MNLTWDEMAFLCSGQEAPASDGGLTQFLSPCGTAYIAVKKESDVYYWGLLAAYRRWRDRRIDAQASSE
jgi:hypothetical protein